MQNTLKIKRTKTALAFNLAIIACEIAAIIIVFFKLGCYPLVYYTEDSNLFALVACTVMAGFQVRYLKSGKRNSALGSNVQIYGGGCAFGNIYRSSCCTFPAAWRGHKRLALYAFLTKTSPFYILCVRFLQFYRLCFLKKNLTLTQNQLSRLQSLH